MYIPPGFLEESDFRFLLRVTVLVMFFVPSPSLLPRILFSRSARLLAGAYFTGIYSRLFRQLTAVTVNTVGGVDVSTIPASTRRVLTY